MSMTTHCPSVAAGTLLANQIPNNSVSASTVNTVDAVGGAGHRRGIICFLHATQSSDQTMPLTILNNIGNNYLTLCNSATADGWVFDFPAYPVDWSVGGVGTFGSFYNMVNADSGHGTALLNVLMLWWDHYIMYVRQRFGFLPPIVVGGFSMGSWLTAEVAINRTSTVFGAFMHCLPTTWETVSSSFTGFNMGAVNWSGINLGTTAFNKTDIPMMVGYATTDGVLGWSATSSPTSNIDAIITNAQTTSGMTARYSSAVDAQTAYPNGHLYLPPDAQVNQQWLTDAIDPYVPANRF